MNLFARSRDNNGTSSSKMAAHLLTAIHVLDGHRIQRKRQMWRVRQGTVEVHPLTVRRIEIELGILNISSSYILRDRT